MNVVSVVFVAVFFGGLFLMILVTKIASSVKEYSKHKLDNELKLKLIERGLSVSDIEQLMSTEADSKKLKDIDKYNQPRPPVKNY